MASLDSIARRYARALILIAQEQNQLEEFGRELLSLEDFFKENLGLFQQLLSPQLSPSQREEVLKLVGEKLGLSQTLVNFLLLLNRKHRLDLFFRVVRAYQILSDQLSGIARAQIFSARPLSEQFRQKLLSLLEKKLNKKIKAQYFQEPDLIAGIKVKVGSLVIDGSVQAQLKMLAEKLKSA